MQIPDPKFQIGEIVRTVSYHRDYNNKLVKIVDMAYQRSGLNHDKEWRWEYRVEDGPIRPCIGEHALKKETPGWRFLRKRQDNKYTWTCSKSKGVLR